eukprot:6185577-Pleurochrysis_carterae.AAC.1
MILCQDPPQRSRGGHRIDAMHVDTSSDIDDDDSAADSNNMTEEDATLFATFKASGLPASLKGENLCHNCLGWGHVANDKSGKPIFPSAVKPHRPGDCIDGVRFLKFRGYNSGSLPASPGGHRNQQYKGSSGDKPKFKNHRFKCFKLKSK